MQWGGELGGAENFFESHGRQPRRQKWRLQPIAFVQVAEKSQIRCLAENPLFTRVSGVFCTTKWGEYDLITAFHVVEHLQDPRGIIYNLGELLKPKGRLIVEVPSADDVSLTLYDCDAFQRFTYWSQPLFLFNASTLALLAKQAGLKVVAIQHYQRYSLANHLYWLSQGKPGGHQRWSFLDTIELSHAYAHVLASLGKTDTLVAHLEPASTV